MFNTSFLMFNDKWRANWMWCLCLEPKGLCAVNLVKSVVLKMSLIFSISK